MDTKQNELEAYKMAIRKKFEVEKTLEYSSFLLFPSRAKLRQLCSERFKENPTANDLRSFKFFFEFDFEASNKNKLKAATDKFRPIETFFKGETDLMDIEGINMAAILVDFNPRPFQKFSKTNYVEHEISVEKKATSELPNTAILPNRTFQKTKRNTLLVAASLLGLFSVGYTAKDYIFPKKECMEWKENHYELVDCLDEQLTLVNSRIIKPYNENEFRRKELIVSDTTHFFKGTKTLVWYSKKNNEVTFFNMDGENPENGAELRKVTPHIIEKYVYK